MFTPQRRGWLGWASSPPSPPGEERALSPHVTSPTAVAVGSAGNAIVEAPPRVSLDENGGIITARGEPEIWKRFREVGSLDEESLEKKDRSALVAHIGKLEVELYDYQYNMGLLLIERKDWTSKCEQMKLAVAEAEENLKREQAAHLIAISESEKREESLRKALGIEKQCVADIENALHELRSEIAELKFTSENKLAQAREMVASTEEKSLTAESKLHAAEALQAEASRKRADTERKLQEIEARENALRRERQSFKSEREAHEAELALERQNLHDWEKKLQEGQERLLEGQRLLNQREEYTNQRDQTLKQIEKELEDARKQIEKDQRNLKEKEAQLSVRLAALASREENAVKREIDIDKKEQELLVLQEKLANRENKEIQRLLDEHKAMLEVRKNEFEAEIEQKRKLVEEGLEKKESAVELREADINRKEEKINKREQQLEKKAEKLKEREKEVELRSKALKEREKTYKSEEKEIEIQKKKLEVEIGEINNAKQELHKLKIELEEEKQRILTEQETLKVTEKERNELRSLQAKLKEEIEDFRAQKQEVINEAEELRKEREKFEKEWEILDEKREQVRKELAQVDEDRKRVSKWLLDEEERLKQEKLALTEHIQSDSEALRLEREAFVGKMENERAEWFGNVERERADLVRDIELQRRELESNIEKRQEEVERLLQERETGFQKEKEREMQHISAQRELAQKEMEEMRMERHKLEREKQEIVTSREHVDRQWTEIKKDIEELQIQREKLKEQRESLHKEREEILRQVENFKKLKAELNLPEDDLKLYDQQSIQQNVNSGDLNSVSPVKMFGHSQEALRKSNFFTAGDTSCVKVDDEPSPLRTVTGASGTSRRLSWLQKCASKLFNHSPGKTVEDIIQKEEAEGSRTVAPEVVVSAEIERVAPEVFAGGEIEPASSADQQNDSMVEAVKGSKQGDVTHNPKPVANFDLSQPSPSGENRHKLNDKAKIRVFKRTRSMKAVVEDAKRIFKAPSEREKNESGNRQKLERNNAVVPTNGEDNGAKEGEDKTESIQEIDDSKGESLGNSKISLQSGRKRRRRYSSRARGEQDAEEAEIQSELTPGGRRKRRQQVTTNGDNSGMGTPAGKRYNFRHSTIANMITTQAVSVEDRDKDFSTGEGQDPTKPQENILEGGDEDPQEVQEISSHEPMKVPSAVHTDKVLPTGEGQDPQSCQENTLEYGGEDLQEVSSHEFTKSETGELYGESDEDDANGEDVEEQDETEEDEEVDEFDDVNEEEGDRNTSLGKKLWTFLTT